MPETKELLDIIRKQAMALEQAKHELVTRSGTYATDRPDLVQAPKGIMSKVDYVPLIDHLSKVLDETYQVCPDLAGQNIKPVPQRATGGADVVKAIRRV